MGRIRYVIFLIICVYSKICDGETAIEQTMYPSPHQPTEAADMDESCVYVSRACAERGLQVPGRPSGGTPQNSVHRI
jgi:hypothetical protein